MLIKADLPETVGPNEFLFCPVCQNENSANLGDWFSVPDDFELRCYCGEPMQLVRKHITHEVLAD